MPHIAIISGSVRTGRSSHRVALYFKKFIEEKQYGSAEILDLKEYNFPLFDERLAYQKEPEASTLVFAEKIRNADAVLLVTPEYNGGYPASVKNVIDLLYDDWQRKPIAITTVSSGPFAGTQVITSLLFSLWKIKAWVIASQFPVPNVESNYDEVGNPKDLESTNKRATAYISELLWAVEAKKRML